MNLNAPFHVLSTEHLEKLNKSIGEDFIKNILGNDAYFTFIHVADTHNGYSGNASKYNEYSTLRIDKKAPNDVNQRQDDIDKALAQVMDISIAYGVNAVLHAGDGTDSWGYKRPYVLKTYMNQLERLNEFGIKYIEIAGNHNLPKESATGNYLEIIGKLPEVYTSFSAYETFEFPEHNVVIHCVPSSYNQEIVNEMLEETRPVEGRINIGMAHLGVTTISHYAENADATIVANLDQLINCEMDYFALGDYHKPTDFGNNIRYSGSIERMGFGEVDNTPQVIMVAIHKETKEVITRELPLKVRPMIDLKEIDASEKTLEEVNQLIVERLTSTDLSEAIVRLRVSNLPKEYKLGLNIDKVEELVSTTLYFKLELRNKTEKSIGTRTSSETKFKGVLEGWADFMKRVEDDGTFDKEKLTKLGFERLVTVYDNEKSEK